MMSVNVSPSWTPANGTIASRSSTEYVRTEAAVSACANPRSKYMANMAPQRAGWLLPGWPPP